MKIFGCGCGLEKPRKLEMKVRSMEERRNDGKVSYVVVDVMMKLNAQIGRAHV